MMQGMLPHSTQYAVHLGQRQIPIALCLVFMVFGFAVHKLLVILRLLLFAMYCTKDVNWCYTTAKKPQQPTGWLRGSTPAVIGSLTHIGLRPVGEG